MKTHPCDIASRGAGPSYGKPRPINTCQKYSNLNKIIWQKEISYNPFFTSGGKQVNTRAS